MGAFEELAAVSEDIHNPLIADWKASGKKVVGFFCSYVPEEILLAAGILPIRLRAPDCSDISAADTYMSHLNCTFMRSCLQFVLEGKYRFLDGLVFTNSCDHVRRLFDILREVRPADYPLLHMISVPHKVDDDLIAWYRGELLEFKQAVERCFDVNVSDDALHAAIEMCNETRASLKKLYDLRKADAPPISGAQTLAVTVAGSSMPRDRFNELTSELFDELSRQEGISGYRARLMMAGSGGCDDPQYFKVMEDMGGLIVADSLCFGSRYFWMPVETDGDPLLELAKSYLIRPSCPRMVDSVSERCDFVKQMVIEFKVDGVVFQRIRYCDLWGGQMLPMRESLKRWGIPLICLEREYALGGIGQLRTRIQAFLESMGR